MSLYGVIVTPYMGVIGYHVTLSDKETLVRHLVATLIYLSQIYSYYIRGDRSPLIHIKIAAAKEMKISRIFRIPKCMISLHQIALTKESAETVVDHLVRLWLATLTCRVRI